MAQILKINEEDIEEGCKNVTIKGRQIGQEGHDFLVCHCKGDLCNSNYEEYLRYWNTTKVKTAPSGD